MLTFHTFRLRLMRSTVANCSEKIHESDCAYKLRAAGGFPTPNVGDAIRIMTQMSKVCPSLSRWAWIADVLAEDAGFSAGAVGGGTQSANCRYEKGPAMRAGPS